ncbi:MAG: hypothetical protein IK140_06480 [Clostridia bacterium]|nr:hypothetical protein [Clostridia bacterium]
MKARTGRPKRVAGAFTDAVPGIVLHIILIPILVIVLEKAGLLLNGRKE